MTAWSHAAVQAPCVESMTAAQAYRAYVGYLVHQTGYTFAFNKISVDTAGWQAVLLPYAQAIIQNIFCDVSDRNQVEVCLRKQGLNAYDWEIDAYLNSKQKFITPMQSPALKPMTAVADQMPEVPALEMTVLKKKAKVRVFKN